MASEFRCSSDDVKYYSGDVFPEETDTYDLVFHTEVMEHIETPGVFLKECLRVLKPGGRMLFSSPFNYKFHFIPFDYYRYTPATLLRLLEEAGFKGIEIYPQGTDITTACQKFISLAYRLLSQKGILFPVRLIRFWVVLVLLPFLGILHVLGMISLILQWGSENDPLGYLVTAVKPDMN